MFIVFFVRFQLILVLTFFWLFSECFFLRCATNAMMKNFLPCYASSGFSSHLAVVRLLRKAKRLSHKLQKFSSLFTEWDQNLAVVQLRFSLFNFNTIAIPFAAFNFNGNALLTLFASRTGVRWRSNRKKYILSYSHILNILCNCTIELFCVLPKCFCLLPYASHTIIASLNYSKYLRKESKSVLCKISQNNWI